jgi:hypothetical protein
MNLTDVHRNQKDIEVDVKNDTQGIWVYLKLPADCIKHAYVLQHYMQFKIYSTS